MLLAAVAASTAIAMSIRSRVRLQTWSSDGLSALLSYDSDGPEGGGSLGFGVLTCNGLQAQVTLSSDFSPGAGDTPQTITEKGCREGVARLTASLKANAFTNVTLEPDGCIKRSGMVSVERSIPPRGWTIEESGKGLVVSEGSRKVLEVPTGSTAEVSPTGRAILVISDGEHVEGLWTRAKAGPFTRCK